MGRRLIVVAAVSLVGGIGQGIAGAAPTPSYSVSCVVGGMTTANWQRVRVDQVEFEWFAPAGSSIVFDPTTVPVSSKAHHGLAYSTTDWSGAVNPATVTVTFTRTDGTTDQVEAGCN